MSNYSWIEDVPRMSQEELTQKYYSEGIQRIDFEAFLNIIKDKINELNERIHFSNADEAEELVSQREKLEKDLKKLKSTKCYRFLNGYTIIRTYPSDALVNEVVKAHLYLAKYFAGIYYKKETYDCRKHDFDDLFQICAETLVYAARQYVPSGIDKNESEKQATFKTYAVKCIENKLNSLYYGEKKKKVKKDLFTYEFERMNLAKKLLQELKCIDFLAPEQDDNDQTLSDSEPNNPYYSLSLPIYRCNKHIREYNAIVTRCKQGTIVPKIKSSNDFLKVYRDLINGSLIEELINESDKDIIRLELNYLGPFKNPSLQRMIYMIDFYLQKLAALKELIDFEKKYMKENEGLTPDDDTIFNHMLEKAKEARKHKNEYSIPSHKMERLESFTERYYIEYESCSLFPETVADEHKEIIRDLEAIIGHIEVHGDNTPEEEFKLKYYNPETEEWDYDSYLQDRLKERRKLIAEKVNEKNIPYIEENRRILELSRFYNYFAQKFSRGDYNSLQESYAILIGLEEYEKRCKGPFSQKILPTEEEGINNLIIEYYEKMLQELSEEQRIVIKLWISSEGYRQHTIPEIARILGIRKSTVQGRLNAAKKSLRKKSSFYELLRESRY